MWFLIVRFTCPLGWWHLRYSSMRHPHRKLLKFSLLLSNDKMFLKWLLVHRFLKWWKHSDLNPEKFCALCSGLPFIFINKNSFCLLMQQLQHMDIKRKKAQFFFQLKIHGFKAKTEPTPKPGLELLQERILADLVLWSSAAHLPPHS